MGTISEIYVPVNAAVDRSQVAVIIPTCNASKCWAKFSAGLRLQRLPASQVLVVDSNSDDGTRELASAEGYQVFRIDRRDFRSGQVQCRSAASEIAGQPGTGCRFQLRRRDARTRLGGGVPGLSHRPPRLQSWRNSAASPETSAMGQHRSISDPRRVSGYA